MPQALRISSEMLMFDLLGSSPGFSSCFGAGGGGVGAAVAVGAAGAGGGSEAQPAAIAVEKRTNAAAYFMTSSLKLAPSWGGAWYTSIAVTAVQKRAPSTCVRNVVHPTCIPMCDSSSRFPRKSLQLRNFNATQRVEI